MKKRFSFHGMLLRLRRFVTEYPIDIAILLIAFALLFTPYYGVGYLGVLVVSSRFLHPLKAFDSCFANFIISGLLLCVSIMLAGIFAMFIAYDNLAVYSIATYVAIIAPILLYQAPRSGNNRKIVTVLDLAIIAISLAGPLLIAGLQLSKYSPETVAYKIANGDGWDNAAHVSILQLNDHYKGYVYPEAQIYSNGAQVSNAYPQGWHLASSNIASGFGQAAFDTVSSSTFRLLVSYVLTIFIWYGVAMYVFLKYAEHLYKKLNSKPNTLLLLAPALATTSLVPVLFVMLPSIHQGFVNHMAIIPFMIILVMVTMQFVEKKQPTRTDVIRYLTLLMPLLAGVALIWTLPAPGLFLMCAYVLLVKNVIPVCFSSLRRPSVLLSFLVTVVLTLVYGSIIIGNIGFNHVYENTGYVAGFPRPELMLILVAVVVIGIYKRYVDVTIKQFLLIISPLTLYMLLLWVTSYLKSDTIGYYQSKMLALISVVIMVFAVAVMIRIIIDLSKHEKRYVEVGVSCVAGLCLVGALVILSNNPVNLNALKRQDWNNDVLMSHAIDWTYRQQSSRSNQLIVFGSNLDFTYNKAMLFNQTNINTGIGFYTESTADDTSKDPLRCVNPQGLFYIGTTSVYNTYQMLDRLENCLDARSKSGLSTTILSEESNRKYFDEINMRNVELIYVNS